MVDLIHGWKGLQMYLETRYGWSVSGRWLYRLAKPGPGNLDPIPTLPHRPRTPARFLRVEVDAWAVRRFRLPEAPEMDAAGDFTLRVQRAPNGAYVATSPELGIIASAPSPVEALEHANALLPDCLERRYAEKKIEGVQSSSLPKGHDKAV